MNNIYEDNDTLRLDKLRHLVKRTKQKLEIDSLISIRNIGYMIRG